jgi:hypothetical protein
MVYGKITIRILSLKTPMMPPAIFWKKFGKGSTSHEASEIESERNIVVTETPNEPTT